MKQIVMALVLMMVCCLPARADKFVVTLTDGTHQGCDLPGAHTPKEAMKQLREVYDSIEKFPFMENRPEFKDVIKKIESVYVVTVRGTTYELLELNDKGKKVNPETMKKEKYWTYLCLDGYLLTINEAEYKENKAVLKQVPDPRPFCTKHPVVCRTWFYLQLAAGIAGIILMCI